MDISTNVKDCQTEGLLDQKKRRESPSSEKKMQNLRACSESQEELRGEKKKGREAEFRIEKGWGVSSFLSGRAP